MSEHEGDGEIDLEEHRRICTTSQEWKRQRYVLCQTVSLLFI